MSHATKFRWLFFELPPYLITTLITIRWLLPRPWNFVLHFLNENYLGMQITTLFSSMGITTLFFRLPPNCGITTLFSGITTLFSGITTLSPELPPYFRELPPYFRNYHVIYSNSFHHSKGSLKEFLKELVGNALEEAISKIYIRVFFRIPVVPHLLRLFGDRRTEPVKPVPMVVTHAPSLQLRNKNNSG